ncbi:MAG: hypothetical protein LUD14_04585 [Clostridiales bacterium]|nr:hypothetical protein [Clostridiales bacterium]
MKKNMLNLLILLEVIVLAIIICAAFLFGNINRIFDVRSDSSSYVSDAEADAQNDNARTVDESVEENADNAENEESEENTESENSDQDAEEEMAFSDAVTSKLDEMSVEEKVAQLFITTPEELTGADQVTFAGETTQTALVSHPVGGLVYSAENFAGAEQIVSMLENTQVYADESTGLELFTVVEETGGENHSPLAAALNYEITASPAELAEEGSLETVYAAASLRAGYVAEAGFNMILGPVADTAAGTDSDLDEMTYGSDVINASQYVAVDVASILAAGVDPVVRAFPGLSEITEDYTAYQAAMEAGVTCIQISALPSSSLTGDDALPCTLSDAASATLRDKLGFEGMLMTSDLASSAVQDYCSIEEAAVLAVNAGMNLIYLTDEFEEAYQAVLTAVNNGEISDVRLNNSVGRVLSVKMVSSVD